MQVRLKSIAGGMLFLPEDLALTEFLRNRLGAVVDQEVTVSLEI